MSRLEPVPVQCGRYNRCVCSIIHAPLCPQAVEGKRGQKKSSNEEVWNDEYEHDSSDDEVRLIL